VARDKTGSGKTIGYILPLLEKLRVENKLGSNRPRSKSKNPMIMVIIPTHFDQFPLEKFLKNTYFLKKSCLFFDFKQLFFSNFMFLRNFSKGK